MRSARRSTLVRASFNVSDAVITSALPATPARKRSRACCDFLFGETLALARGVDLLARRRDVEHRAAHVDSDLLSQIAAPRLRCRARPLPAPAPRRFARSPSNSGPETCTPYV